MNRYGRRLFGINFRVENLLAPAPFFLALILVVSLVWVPAGSAQGNAATIWQVHAMESDRSGLSDPVGVAFSSRANSFQVLEGSNSAEFVRLNPFAERVGTAHLGSAVKNPINIAYDNYVGRLFFIAGASSQLMEVREDAQGNLDPTTLAHHDIKAWGVQDAEGITVNENGVLFLLDAAGPRIVRVEPGAGGDLDAASVSASNLSLAAPHGIAYDVTTGHLHVMTPADRKLYELSQAGETIGVRDLTEFELKNPQGMVFAPSGDQTDDPAQLSLYVADGAAAESSGQVIEYTLVAPAALPAGTTMLSASLVRTFDTSSWSNPSPDPGGIEYIPATNRLMITDSEVEESVSGNPPAYWHGYNVFISSLTGSPGGNCTTFTSSPANLAWNNFSSEPTGVAHNENNNHYFFTHDGSYGRIYELSPGGDGTYCTPDDIVTRYNIAQLYGATDAEDISYGNKTLYVSDGINAEVWLFPLGPDGVISSDDGPVTHWDTASLGFHDLEGIDYNEQTGTLFIVSTQGKENYLGETSTSGQLLQAYDLSLMGTQSNIRSAVEYAPGSQNASIKSIYIASRGVDNNSNRLENDGKVWEINILNTPTPTPTPGPSPTPAPVTDLVFADGFESGNVSAWSSSVTDSGNLGVSNTSALVGGMGMQAVVNDNNSIYVNDDTPNAEKQYRARFYFDPNSITMTSGDSHYLLMGYSGTSTAVLRCAFRYYNGNYQVRYNTINDSGTWLSTSWQTISNAPHSLEVDWLASTGAGANNGSLTVWIDGAQKGSLTGVDNDTRVIDRVRLGAVSGIDSGTRGTYYFDAFESRRQSYIGP